MFASFSPCSNRFKTPFKLQQSKSNRSLPSRALNRRNASRILNLQQQNQEVLSSQWMEDAYDALAERALSGSKAQSSGQSTRYLVGVAGGPGSGKTTLAQAVVAKINQLAAQELAVNIPMDGFHYYRRELDQMPDPKLAHARRGAHWTFDAEAFVDCLKTVKSQGGKALTAPSFDHGVGDPKADAIKVLPQHHIVISEGNYLFLPEGPWAALIDQAILEDTWYVDCDLDVAMERVFERQTGHGVAPEVSRGRISGNDRPNGELIETTKGRAAILIPSLPFKSSA